MTAINAVTDYALDGDVGVITLNSPPVNALSAGVRDGLSEGMQTALADAGAKAIVIICEGRTFIAGADITEFGGASRRAPASTTPRTPCSRTARPSPSSPPSMARRSAAASK